jgi:hypothetical protein
MVPAPSDTAEGVCLPQLRLQFLHHQGALWHMSNSPALGVNLSCANCGTGDTIPLSTEETRRCGFDDPN